MSKKSLLKDLNTNDQLDHYLLLSKLEIRQTKSGNDYLWLEFSDSSMTLQSKKWDGFEEMKSTLKAGEIYRVLGSIEEYLGSKQIKLLSLEKPDKSLGIGKDYFLPKSGRDFNEMLRELKTFIRSVKDQYLNRLLRTMFSGEEYEAFIRMPAGKSWHHSYIHGLLEHSLEIAKICNLVASFHEEIDRDLLTTAALLHDFGKTSELEIKGGFDYSDKGQLLGHIVICAMDVDRLASSIKGFPEKRKTQLLHLILSHQGRLEFASPVVPKTIEAIALYQADELSAKTNAYKYSIKKSLESEEGWTRYINLAGTSLYSPGQRNYTEEPESNEGPGEEKKPESPDLFGSL